MGLVKGSTNKSAGADPTLQLSIPERIDLIANIILEILIEDERSKQAAKL
jgi:hypothetical protein